VIIGFIEVSELVEKTYRLAQFSNSKNNWLIVFSKKVSGDQARFNIGTCIESNNISDSKKLIRC
jgi:hypothetical protein